MFRFRPRLSALVIGVALLQMAASSSAVPFTATNLVSDNQALHPAQITDPGLINAWGLSYSPTSPFWISSTDAGTATVYRVNGATQATVKASLTVAVPSGSPTGQVFNANATAFKGDPFLFVSEDGSVAGWNPGLGSTAEVLSPASAANSYKGAAIGHIVNGPAISSYLYAANFRAGTIDVHKGSATDASLSGSFVDPNLPTGFAPFNASNLGGSIYVAYAMQNADKDEEIKGAGLGLVNRFDVQGNFLNRVTTGGTLNAPWGMAIAPSSFGDRAGALLVGNFGDGRISEFDRTTGAYLGQALDSNGQPLSIDGLWALSPGNDGNAGSSSLLYFTAGPDEEAHGVFGVLNAVPEPSTWAMLGLGLVLVGGTVRRRR